MRFSSGQTLLRVTRLNRGQRGRRFARGLLAGWQTSVVGIRSSGALCIFVVAMDCRSQTSRSVDLCELQPTIA